MDIATLVLVACLVGERVIVYFGACYASSNDEVNRMLDPNINRYDNIKQRLDTINDHLLRLNVPPIQTFVPLSQNSMYPV